MMQFFDRKGLKGVLSILLLGIAVLVFQGDAEASGGTKIHFISLNSTTDAILLESNGQYGMVDSGEDWDYPDGEEYELREGVTIGIGYEQQVIHYLEQLGVEKLDFYIATHSHSDHIGSGDEILRHFPTDRLYINEYKDEYLYDGHKTDPNDPYYVERTTGDRLWDNQYVYDCMIETAKEQGTEIITNLDNPENEQYLSFKMGDMQIEVMNTERERDSDGNIIPVPDENCNSFVTKVTAFDKVALLTADMDPWVSDATECGDTAKIAQLLIDQLWTEEDTDKEEENSAVQVSDDYETVTYEEWNGVTLSTPGEQLYQTRERKVSIDESKTNTGKTISIDLLKMCHHSIDYNNTTYFLTSLNPKTVIITGFMDFYNEREKACMPDAEVFATATDSAAVVGEFTEEGILTEYVKTESEWMEIDGKLYYFDDNGKTYTDSSSHVIDGAEYCFDKMGAVETANRWVLTDDGWKYWKEGSFARSEWIEYKDDFYYCEEDGKMVTGWQKIDGKTYYFAPDGKMLTDEWISGHYVDKNGVWIAKYSTAQWIASGNRWWYCHGDGNYSGNKWEMIDGVRYYFDASGWMATGWQKIGGDWYYFSQSGQKVTDTWIGDYYVDESGIWSESVQKNRWIASGGYWWYRHADGSYTASDWEYIDGDWYYFNASGWMVTGWQLIRSNWYYFGTSGVLATDRWIGDYYVDASGVWDVNRHRAQWIASGGYWWYRHADGSYTASDWEYIDGYWYYFDASGWMTTGWQRIDGKWYYMAGNGAMVSNAWVGNYYLKADGTMATAEWVDEGRYYVDESGLWVRKH